MRVVWLAWVLLVPAWAGCLVPEVEDDLPGFEQPPLDRFWGKNPIQVVNHSDVHRTYRLSLDLADTITPYLNRVHVIAEGSAHVTWNWTMRHPTDAENHEVSVLAMHAGALGEPDAGARSTGAIHATRDDTWNLLVAGGGLQGARLLPESETLEHENQGVWQLGLGEEIIVDYGSMRHWVGHPRTHDIHVELDVQGPSHVLVAAHHTTRPWVEAGWGLYAQPFGPDVQVNAGPATVTAAERIGFEAPVAQATLIFAAGPDPNEAQAIQVHFQDEVHENPELFVRTARTEGLARIDVTHAVETDTGPFWLVANTHWPFVEAWTPNDDRMTRHLSPATNALAPGDYVP